jgi:hypothetical protein
MPAQEMRAVLVRLTRTEYALLQTILREDGRHLQTFFRQAAKRKISQRAQAFAAAESEDREDPAQNNAPPGLNR